jgi:ABC-2 type transport system permease protein
MHRVNAVLLRHLFTWPRSLERLADAFWWPVFNLFTWGLVTSFLDQQTGSLQLFVNVFLGGTVMWLLVYRIQEEMGVTFLQEAWDRNLLNMLVSPLTIWEFNAAILAIGMVKLILSAVLMLLLSYVFYAFNIFRFGFIILPYAINLLVVGWWLGLIINGLIIRYGYRVQAFAWTLSLVIQPFSGVFYPVSAMPVWMQHVAKVLPTSYIFEGMRLVMLEGKVDTAGLLAAIFWNIVYSVFGIWYFVYCYRKAKESGMIMKFS